MFFNKIWANKKIFSIIVFAFLLFVSGLLEPIIKKNRINNWNNFIVEETERIENKIQEAVRIKIDQLIAHSRSVKKHILQSLIKNNIDQCLLILSSDENKIYQTQLFDSNLKLISWNDKLSIDSSSFHINLKKHPEVFFNRKDLYTYLSLVDSVQVKQKTFYLGVSQAIEKHFNLPQLFDEQLSLQDSLSRSLSTSIKINYNKNAQFTKDGRQYSFNVLNNFNNKCGVVTFEKPALDSYIVELENFFKAVQSILVLIIYILIGWYGFEKRVNLKSNFLKFILIIVYLTILRILLFYFGIPSSYFHNQLTDPANFSSVFAFGMVQSPLDFFITVFLLLLSAIIGYKYTEKYFIEIEKRKNRFIKFSLVCVIALVVCFIILRGLGASLRSVVFDSTIRYFKEFTLLPSPSILLMDFNILILGFAVLLVSVLLVKWIIVNLPVEKEKFSNRNIFILFIIFQIAGLIIDYLQKQPQTTPFIRVLFITILFVLIYYFKNKIHRTIEYVYFGITSSVIVVSLLVYYNSEIERESLKTTAFELTRYNENLHEFIVYQSLIESKEYFQELDNSTSQLNFSSIAFELWSKSLLYRESIPSSLQIYSLEKKPLGKFSVIEENNYSNAISHLDSVNNEPKVFHQLDPFSNKKIIAGITLVNNQEGENFIVEVVTNLEMNFLKKKPFPQFLLTEKTGLASATNTSNLNIFSIVNGKLFTNKKNSFDNFEFSQIANATFSERNEAWLTADIGGERNLIYLLKIGSENDEILGVALEEKKFAWKLSDFFKVFFIHSIIILIILLLYSFKSIVKWKTVIMDYRTKLTAAFIIVAVIPLIIISIYIRIINEDRNKELINVKLIDAATQIENYIRNYSIQSTLNEESIFNKAKADLNIDFDIYDSQNLLYSTYTHVYKSGIFSTLLNPKVYTSIIFGAANKIFIIENFGEKSFNSFYSKVDLNGKPRIINVNTLLNELDFPLSETELDIFLFGILSLVILLLIIFSTVLAGQISSPIKKLIHATRSIGSGDLNIEINEKLSGEIGELTDGFNMMVKKLKKSQHELAQLEREIAWKEMAKQVAHEIKNPLTPMKLSIQQLIAAYQDKSPKFNEIFTKVTNTVITQIETLKNIASEFSNFARMPKLNIERINIIPLIKDAINLFYEEQKQINLHVKESDIYVNSDSDHLSRTFINLIRNSLQAKSTEINIEIITVNKKCEIRVIDNGIGIVNENIDKVFGDNFTTKKEGMGLGLSMAKKFLESIGGTINIEKTSNSGTTILITLSIASNE